MLLVLPHLGAAVGVGPGVYPVHASLQLRPQAAGQGLGNSVDTAHRGDNPKLIADSHTASSAAVALEVLRRQGGRSALHHLGRYGSTDVQAGAQVVGVYPLPRLNGRLGPADGIAVFDHSFPGRDGNQRRLMSLGDILAGRDLRSLHGDGFVRPDGLQSHGHIVLRVNAQRPAHASASRLQASRAALIPCA